MSRAEALSALTGQRTSLVCGLTWLPSQLLRLAGEDGGPVSPSVTLTAIASSIPVDLAFVAADGPEPSGTVEALHAADIAAIWTVDGVFTRVARAQGWTEVLRETAADPDTLATLLDAALIDALADVRAAREAGADGVLIGDDLAGPSGPLMSPDYILDALIPRYRQLALEATALGLPALFHSDGDIRALIPALARVGFSAVHLAGLDSDAFATSATHARRAGLGVLGGIPVQALSRDAREAGSRAGSIAASLGGILVCDDGGITTLEQLVAFGASVDAARDGFGGQDS